MKNAIFDHPMEFAMICSLNIWTTQIVFIVDYIIPFTEKDEIFPVYELKAVDLRAQTIVMKSVFKWRLQRLSAV